MEIGMQIREERKEYGDTQQSLGEALGVSRETICAVENGRNKLTPDLSYEMIKRYNSPFLAMDIAYNYTNSFGIRLNGKNVDTHRLSSTMKTEEELMEILEAMKVAMKALIKPVESIKHYEKEGIVSLVHEMFDGITALSNTSASLCREYELNWDEEWGVHHLKLRQKEYVE